MVVGSKRHLTFFFLYAQEWKVWHGFQPSLSTEPRTFLTLSFTSFREVQALMAVDKFERFTP